MMKQIKIEREHRELQKNSGSQMPFWMQSRNELCKLELTEDRINMAIDADPRLWDPETRQEKARQKEEAKCRTSVCGQKQEKRSVF